MEITKLAHPHGTKQRFLLVHVGLGLTLVMAEMREVLPRKLIVSAFRTREKG